MTILEEFGRRAAKEFLQSVVFVDDEIYAKSSGQPIDDTSSLPVLKSPFSRARKVHDATQERVNDSSEWVPYHPKEMVESFAREGMVCALYEPEEAFATDKESVLFRLCDRADIVILDWNLFNEDGRNILPLIKNLVDASQSSVPHHVRLCVIYTTKPDLLRVTDQVFVALGGDQAAGLEVKDETTITFGATRIVVLGKPNVNGRNDVAKALEVHEKDLADRVINEFSKMTVGLLSSYVLHGLAAVRRNTKRIVDKFASDMEGPFIVHRAQTLESEDAFDQLPELLAEELLAVIQDGQIAPQVMKDLAKEVAMTIVLNPAELGWQAKQGKQARPSPEFARMFLAEGRAAIIEECNVPKEKDVGRPLHKAMGCDTSHGEKRLAALFGVRTRYITDATPNLGFGTIVRYSKSAEVEDWVYAFCLMPMCDAIRLDCSDGNTSAFPFWSLSYVGTNPKGLGVVVELSDGSFLHLVANGKASEKLWTAHFAAGPAGTVTAVAQQKTYMFHGERSLEWIAQLKPAHAQRIAHDIGQKFSRVGVMEAEWLRFLSEGKN